MLTRKLVATAIETLMEGEPVQIAHRLGAAELKSDRLSGGRVVASGDHKSLMAIKDGMYRRMVKQNLNTGSERSETVGDNGRVAAKVVAKATAAPDDRRSDADVEQIESDAKSWKLSVVVPTKQQRHRLRRPQGH